MQLWQPTGSPPTGCDRDQMPTLQARASHRGLVARNPVLARM